MRGTRLRQCGPIAASVLFVFLVIPTSFLYSRIKPVGFPVPSRILQLGQAVTPGEYAQLRQAIMVNWQREKTKVMRIGPALGTDFTHIIAARVHLGALGEGLVVEFAHSPQCGATGNCPMAVYIRVPNGYRRVISAGGGGYAVLPSGGPVPDVAIYGSASAFETSAELYHYTDGQFVAGRGATCTGKSTSAICAARIGYPQALSEAISPAEYAALRPLVESDFEKQSPALARRYSYDSAHGTHTAIGLGPCGYNRNCRIWIYGRSYRNPKNKRWLMLSNVTGWGIGGRGLVIARRLSPGEDELTRYKVLPSGQGVNWNPAGRMVPAACEIVTPKSGRWPARWDAAALVERPVSCFKSPAASAAEIPAADTTNVSTVVQDGDGTIWGIGSGFSSHLYRWRNGGWSQMPSPIPIASSSLQQREYLEANGQAPHPIRLWRGPNGGVLVQWLEPSPTPRSELIWQRGDQTRILGQLPAPGQPGPLGRLQIRTVVNAPLGTILIGGNGGTTYRNGVPMHPSVQALFRIGANRQLEKIYTVAPDQYLRMRFFRIRARGHYIRTLPVHATHDAQGKVWIWCGWQGLRGPGGRVFRGFLVTDGKTVQYHRLIRLPFFQLSSLDVWDQHHLVAAISHEGLFTINTSTFRIEHIAEPQPGAFFFAKKVFRVGADRYVLVAGREPYWRVRPEFRSFLTGALWRLHDGRWTEIASGLGDATGTGLATPQGLWFTTTQFHGLWFVPPSGPARRINWREGLELATVNQIFRLPGGNILATDAGRYARTRSVEFPPARMLAAQPAPQGFSVLHLQAGLEADRRHNLWALLPHGVLGQWNGSRWIDHPLPAALKPERIIGLDVDTEGRVWLFPGCRLGPMAFFDIDQNRWSPYDSYPDALASRAHPVEFLHPKDDPVRPIYGPHSQIAFVGKCGAVNYFDGSAWQTFRWRMLPRNRNIAIPPFFDSAGHLALDVNHTTWQWTPDAHWQETSEAPPQNYVRMLPNPFAPPPPVPEGCQSPLPLALVKDSRGQSWWVADDALYEGTPGSCRVVLSGSVRQPFIDGRKLLAAKVGPRGNAFLKTLSPSSYIMVPRATYAGRSAASH